jgi:hypothetical protein
LNEDLIQFLHSQSRPVVIMHHETPTAAHFIQRNLASAYGNGGNGMGNTTLVKPLDEYQISQYQVNQHLLNKKDMYDKGILIYSFILHTQINFRFVSGLELAWYFSFSPVYA